MAPTEPHQDRSRETHDRLLEAAERLLAERPWSAISVQRLAREAGFTTGALYGRFGGKREVLPLLVDRLRLRTQSSLEALEDAAARLSGPEVLDLLMLHLCTLYRQGGHLLRSLREAAQNDEPLRQDLADLNLEVRNRLVALLATAYGFSEDDPRTDVALLLLLLPVREMLVDHLWPFPETAVEPALAEVRRAVGLYLETPP